MNYYCIRCGDVTPGEYCNACLDTIEQEERQAYDAGQPNFVEVGYAFGGPVAIAIHHKAEFCGCMGTGHHVTDLDSIHPCPHHNGPHPEA